MITDSAPSSNGQTGTRVKMKTPARPGGPYRHISANELHLFVISDEFREIERAIKLVRSAERTLSQLPFAMKLLTDRIQN